MKGAATMTAISAPSIGPAVLVIFGLRLPIAALGLSMVGLLLARYIAPRRQRRRFTAWQNRALTALLALLLLVIVSGDLSACTIKAAIMGGDETCPREPLGVGMATAFGVGLGTSGLLAVEFLGDRISRAFRAMFGGNGAPPGLD
jgi:hypothetical protein